LENSIKPARSVVGPHERGKQVKTASGGKKLLGVNAPSDLTIIVDRAFYVLTLEKHMLYKYIAVSLLTTALMTGVASAQTSTGNKDTARPSATTQTEGEYSAYKLVGVNVYNQGNEKIGEIKDILLAKSGKADKVILSVGGFLGLGEHYVAIPFDQIKWIDEPVRSASGDTRTTTGAATTSTRNANEKWYPDHAVYNATKDQLKAMPEFKY
jgi:ribosomal 30S subunit maturation factor RimM